MTLAVQDVLHQVGRCGDGENVIMMMSVAHGLGWSAAVDGRGHVGLARAHARAHAQVAALLAQAADERAELSARLTAVEQQLGQGPCGAERGAAEGKVRGCALCCVAATPRALQTHVLQTARVAACRSSPLPLTINHHGSTAA